MSEIRVLHVLHRLSTGGITNWLVDVLRSLHDSDVRFDFAVHRDGNSPYLQEIVSRGCRIFRLPDRRRATSYCASLYRVLRENGPYAAVHSHYHLFSVLVLSVAAAARVPVRVAHAHKDSGPSPKETLSRRLLRLSGGVLLRQCCTDGLACSPRGACSLWGPNWRRRRSVQLFPYGFDAIPFMKDYDVLALREACGVPASAFVVGHVGNFVQAKNHAFLLRVFAELLSMHSAAYLVLVGDGDLRQSILDAARSLGISDRVRMLGFRSDLAAVLSIMDVLVFPSLIEGLPITVLQAQYARLPVVASTAVPPEAAISENIHFLDLSYSPRTWAERVLDAAANCQPWPAADDARFAAHTIADNARRLTAIYRGARYARAPVNQRRELPAQSSPKTPT